MREVTQEELANAFDVTRRTIIAIEKGKYDPSLSRALGIARYFRLPGGRSSSPATPGWKSCETCPPADAVNIHFTIRFRPPFAVI
jgi:putative transcriptional regulator